MTVDDLVDLARGYTQLGGAVMEQLDDVLRDRIDETNPNALRLMLAWLRKVEQHSGDDDELQDDVSGMIQTIEGQLEDMPEDEEAES